MLLRKCHSMQQKNNGVCISAFIWRLNTNSQHQHVKYNEIIMRLNA